MLYDTIIYYKAKQESVIQIQQNQKNSSIW